MKILFVISTLRSGGAERVCSLIASEFSKFHDVSLVKFDDKEPFYELSKGVKLINLNEGVSNLGFVGNFKKRFFKIFKLRNLIKNAKFDAVISFLDSTNVLVLASTLGLKQNVIISEHTSFDTPKPKWLNPLKRLLYPFSNGLSVLTKRDLIHYEKFVKNVSVIHNPFFAKRVQENEIKKENLVIFVGRLIALKNCKMFIKVARNLSDKGYKFVVAGDGEQRQELENFSNELNANVEFLGNVPDIENLYKRAKILLSTSIYEGLGNTLIEATCYDCARVATKTSGARELITHDKNGILVDIDDDLAMSEAVYMLLCNEEKRKEICKNATINLSDFSVENIYKKWLELIQKGKK